VLLRDLVVDVDDGGVRREVWVRVVPAHTPAPNARAAQTNSPARQPPLYIAFPGKHYSMMTLFNDRGGIGDGFDQTCWANWWGILT
jgi:hypothetical protein